ncbi:hypothetical protein D3C84_875440 [compost metagenome]
MAIPGAAAMACTRLPEAGASSTSATSIISSRGWVTGGNGSTSSPRPSSMAANSAGKASAATLGSAMISSTWPRRAPRLSNLLKLFTDTALS